jgi:hypothetical protein
MHDRPDKNRSKSELLTFFSKAGALDSKIGGNRHPSAIRVSRHRMGNPASGSASTRCS